MALTTSENVVRGVGDESGIGIGGGAPMTPDQGHVLLAEGDEKYRRLAGSNVVGVAEFDDEGRVLEANDECLRIVGFTREELAEGRVRWDELPSPEWRARAAQLAAEVRRFERYWRGTEPGSGVGLGLSIAKALVERHGGRIWEEGEPGRGTTFGFRLPSAQPDRTRPNASHE